LIQYFQSPLNEDLHGGSEPVPNATLINEAQNVHFPIKPNKSYLFRVINMGGFAAQYLQFDQHDMTVVEIDGVYTKPHRVSQLFLAAAQRYSVIVQSKRNTDQNFAIVASMDDGMFDPGVTPENLNNNVSMKELGVYCVLYVPLLTAHRLPHGLCMMTRSHCPLLWISHILTKPKMTPNLSHSMGKALSVL
jgi:hypothetical protein